MPCKAENATTYLIEKRLEELLEHKGESYADVFEAAKYSVLTNAKRIRPKILLDIISAYGLPIDIGIDPACAIEYIHTYSLIHDDLPCMDDDDLRRGKPSLHRKFGEGHAVLTGDFLLTYAFEILASCKDLSEKQKLALIKTLSLRAGAHGMIGGQVLDLSFSSKKIDPKDLYQMHVMKTAALFIACFESGGIIADVSKEELDLLTQSGTSLGLAFQIIDDILDETGEEAEMGKSLSDKKNAKSTSVSLFGLDIAKEKAEELLDSFTSSLPRHFPYLDTLTKGLRFFLNSCMIK